MIETGIAEITRQCSFSTPDTAALGAARLWLIQARLSRSQYVREVIIPKLQQGAETALQTDILDLQRAFTAKRLASIRHVTLWSSKSITDDWQGYRDAAKHIWAMMIDQINRERAVLDTRSKQLEL